MLQMRQTTLTFSVALALSFAAMPASASNHTKPECEYNEKTYRLGTIIRHGDGHEYVCLCNYDPGSKGGYWACDWQLYKKALESQ